jgi:HK97 family phage prohead protease
MTEHKSYPIDEFKAEAGTEQGTFEALVAVFGNLDHGGDRIEKGAFTRTLGEWQAKGRKVPVLWSHNADDPPIGLVNEAAESGEGLLVKARLLVEHNQTARSIHGAMKAGALNEFSFGYSLRDFDHVTENGQKLRVLKDIDLHEISPVFRGMNPATRLGAVKTHQNNSKLNPTTVGRGGFGEDSGTAVSQAQPHRLQVTCSVHLEQGQRDGRVWGVASDPVPQSDQGGLAITSRTPFLTPAVRKHFSGGR